MKGIHNAWKEVKLFLLKEDIILYAEKQNNPRKKYKAQKQAQQDCDI